jgi:hypothetical protein
MQASTVSTISTVSTLSPSNSSSTTNSAVVTRPTQHALLVAWGHFAQSLQLVQLLQHVPIPQKIVTHTPAAKLATLLIGILSGMSHLSDLHKASAPLTRDYEVAAAWDLPALVEASGVSRTLAACSAHSLTHLLALLDELTRPFVQRAIADLLARQQPLLLDVDLTGRPVTTLALPALIIRALLSVSWMMKCG